MPLGGGLAWPFSAGSHMFSAAGAGPPIGSCPERALESDPVATLAAEARGRATEAARGELPLTAACSFFQASSSTCSTTGIAGVQCKSTAMHFRGGARRRRGGGGDFE